MIFFVTRTSTPFDEKKASGVAQPLLCLCCVECPILSRRAGVIVCTLRIRYTEPDYTTHLRDCFVSLFELYGEGYFDVTTTANVILASRSPPPRYSVFYGQSFATSDYSRSRSQVVGRLSDVSNLRVRFGVEDFESVFFANHSSSDVIVEEIISLVYIITRPLEDFLAQRREGNHPRQLW
jgi:hypothetical protein